jgi:hypothetical protein
MAITARNGSSEAYSSAPGPGSTGRNIFTDTSTIISISATATTEPSPPEENILPKIVPNFMATQCMIPTGTKHLVDTTKYRQKLPGRRDYCASGGLAPVFPSRKRSNQ